MDCPSGLLVPHQANLRILDAATRMLGLDPDRVLVKHRPLWQHF